MKKFTFGAFILGVGILGIISFIPQAHAQVASSISPDQAAILNQELEAMKSTLLSLESQTVTITPPAAPTIEPTPAAPVAVAPSSALTESQLASLTAILDNIGNTLSGIKTKLQNHELTVTDGNALSQGLAQIAQGLTLLNSSLETVAVAPQNQPVAVEPAQENPISNPGPEITTNQKPITVNPLAETQPIDNVSKTASAFSVKQLWPGAVTGGIVGLVLVILLFWWLSKDSAPQNKNTSIQNYTDFNKEKSA